MLVDSTEGNRLVLWDTPGFGDSARLARRLAQDGTALGWFLSRVWDCFADCAFHHSQQALRNVRDASEDPAACGYVDPEMQVLGWMSRPIVVLLNQVGPSRGWQRDVEEVERWREAVLAAQAAAGLRLASARTQARQGADAEAVTALLEPAVGRVVRVALARLYPGVNLPEEPVAAG